MAALHSFARVMTPSPAFRWNDTISASQSPEDDDCGRITTLTCVWHGDTKGITIHGETEACRSLVCSPRITLTVRRNSNRWLPKIQIWNSRWRASPNARIVSPVSRYRKLWALNLLRSAYRAVTATFSKFSKATDTPRAVLTNDDLHTPDLTPENRTTPSCSRWGSGFVEIPHGQLENCQPSYVSVISWKHDYNQTVCRIEKQLH